MISLIGKVISSRYYTMEAIQFNFGEKKLELVQKPIPTIKDPSHILVKVAYSGICGTDLHIIEGHFPCNSNGLVLGHEFSGVVVDIGAEVDQFIKGDHVAVDPNNGCGRCHFCHSGDPHYCKVAELIAPLEFTKMVVGPSMFLYRRNRFTNSPMVSHWNMLL